MTTETTSPYGVSGWVRNGRGRWKLFCRGATEQAVLDQLLGVRPGLDKLVKEGDADPNLDGRRPR
jgi:hypothetical protein